MKEITALILSGQLPAQVIKKAFSSLVSVLSEAKLNMIRLLLLSK